MLGDEELTPKVKRLLEDLSISEIKERIERLRQEIVLCEAEIARKEETRRAAEAAFFRK